MCSFAIVGGDKRNIALAQALQKEGQSVNLYGFENADIELPMQCKNLKRTILNAGYIIGPTPCSHNGGALNAPYSASPLLLEEVFGLLTSAQMFIAGYIKPEVTELAKRFNVKIIDMLEREELLVLNAIPTA